MKNLETLINELCPEGVEFVKVGEVCDTITDFVAAGSFADLRKNVTYNKEKDFAQLVRTTDLKSKFNNPKDFVYVSKSAYNYLWRVHLNEESIILPNVGNCGEVYYIVPQMLPYEENVLGPNAILVRSSTANNKFLSYIFQTVSFRKSLKKITSQVGQTKFNKTNFKALEIPLPPIEIQTEIVRILDKFTELEAELEAELDCRKRQYKYYRDKLLSFENVEGQDVEWKKIGEFCDTLSGFPFESSKFQDTGIKLMRGKNVKRGYFDFNEEDDRYWESSEGLEKYLLQDGDIIISMDGSLVGKSFAMLKEEHLPLLLVQRVARVRAIGVNQKYLYHNISNGFSKYVDKKKTGGAIPHVSMKDIQNFEIPVPSLQEQERIANILDRFESLTTSLTAGLPAEISARRQQYEHYRDQLLTFKRKSA